jgi:hypothetical protein
MSSPSLPAGDCLTPNSTVHWKLMVAAHSLLAMTVHSLVLATNRSVKLLLAFAGAVILGFKSPLLDVNVFRNGASSSTREDVPQFQRVYVHAVRRPGHCCSCVSFATAYTRRTLASYQCSRLCRSETAVSLLNGRRPDRLHV